MKRLAALTGLVALIVGVVLFVRWEWGDEIEALRVRRSVPEAVQPFFPDPDPRADAIIAATRDALTSWAAANAATAAALSDEEATDDDDSAAEAPERLTGEQLLERHPALAEIDYGERWIVSVYVPVAGTWIRPRIQPLEDGVYAAANALYRSLSKRERTPEAIAAASIKVDLVVGEERVIPEDGGPHGAALDEGVDGIVLRHPDEATFWYLPSLSVERKVSRRKIHGRARYYARELADWRKKHTKEAEFRAFRTKAWVESEPGGAIVAVTRGNVDIPEITPELLKERIDLAGQYMTRSTNEAGMIRYQYEATEDDDDFLDYNMLRHAGSVYAMAQTYRLTQDEDLLQAAIRAMGFYLSATREDKNHPGERYVLSVTKLRPDLSPRIGRHAKLGGIGLGLCALVEIEKARAGSVDMDVILQMARHAERQQNPDGSFESFYDHSGQGKRLRKSIYYSGEAILGLLRVHQLTGDEHWLDVAVKGADYLVHERWRALGLHLYVPMDAWLIQGLEEMDRVRPDKARMDYAFTIGEQIARHKFMDPLVTPPDMLGAGLSGVASLPHAATAGSFGEALSAGARLEARRRPGETTHRTWALYNAEYNLRNQYWGPNSYMLPDRARSHGGFRVKPDHGEIRNDHVQHSMSGLFGLLDLLDESAPDIGQLMEDRW